MIDEQRWDRAKKTTINGTDYITKTIFPKNTCIHKLISYAQDILSDQSNKAGINKYTGTTNSGIPGTIYLDAKDNVATHFPLSKE